MLASILCFIFLIAQGGDRPTVNRVFVTTPYNASIVYEYVNASIREDQPVNDGSLECVRSQLLATGLFSAIQIRLKPVGRNKVDVDIAPVWIEEKDGFVITEIAMEGFNEMRVKPLLRTLEKKGVKPGARLLKFPLPAIRQKVLESVHETYSTDRETMHQIEEQLSDMSFRIVLLSPRSVKLVLTTISNPICG